MTVPSIAPGAADRARRIERSSRVDRARETSAAAIAGETLEIRNQKREARAGEWAKWLRQRMEDAGCTDPSEILPDAFARLEQLNEDRVTAAIRKVAAKLRKALTS
jgi:hypothetical protein